MRLWNDQLGRATVDDCAVLSHPELFTVKGYLPHIHRPILLLHGLEPDRLRFVTIVE